MISERINPAELARPSGFSHAVAATGRMVFLAGQTGVDRDGNVAEGGVVPQFERALTNLLTALGAAGGLPSDLVCLTVYLTDMAGRLPGARQGKSAPSVRLAGTEYPAMAAVGVTRLWLPETCWSIRASPRAQRLTNSDQPAAAQGRACRAKSRPPSSTPTHPSGSSSAGSPGSRYGSRRQSVSTRTYAGEGFLPLLEDPNPRPVGRSADAPG